MIQGTMIPWVFFYIFMICEPGQRVTDQFQNFGIEFERCEWNKLPSEMQQMFLILLSDTQQPKNLQTYGSIECTRETFKKVFEYG